MESLSGIYVTIDIKNLNSAGEEEIERAALNVNIELQKIINTHIKPEEDILVVGLGNFAVTPDSLRAKSSARYRYNKTFATLCTTIFG